MVASNDFGSQPGNRTSNSITPGVLNPPFEGCWTGDLIPVRLNHRYKGGKLADMPMYNKASDINPVQVLNKTTIIQTLTRSL